MGVLTRKDLDALLTPRVDQFAPVTLEELNRVQLMDRTDTKYVMHIADLPEILSEAVAQYKVLEVSGNRHRRYETHYFDSKGYQLYRMHHNGKASRYKLRIRKYTDTGQTFYELKSKNPKKRTIKIRRQYDGELHNHSILNPFRTFCPDAVDRLEGVHQSLSVCFDRLTLVHAEKPERITLDTGLLFYHGSTEKALLNLCVVEVKQPRDSSSSFASILHRHKTFPLRISKYCLGMILHHQELKKNNFKPRMLRLQKIVNKYNNDNYIHII